MKAAAGAGLIGTTMAPGVFLPKDVPALQGSAAQVAVRTNEHFRPTYAPNDRQSGRFALRNSRGTLRTCVQI
jgi:hypothetical protein